MFMMFLDHQVRRGCNISTEHIWTSDLDLFPPNNLFLSPLLSVTPIIAQFGKSCTFPCAIFLCCKYHAESLPSPSNESLQIKTEPNFYLKWSQWIPNQLAELGGENKYFYPSCALPFYGYPFPVGVSVCSV